MSREMPSANAGAVTYKFGSRFRMKGVRLEAIHQNTCKKYAKSSAYKDGYHFRRLEKGMLCGGRSSMYLDS